MTLTTKKKKQPSPHEKRRHGQHHKQGRRYQNTYWPYLPLIFIVTLGVLFNSLWPTIQSAVLGYATSTSVSGLLLETNNERVAQGVGKLALNAQLNSAAQSKANDMAVRDYWSHNTPEGNAPWVFISNAGYPYDAAGENLAYGFDSSNGTVSGWMGSPSHRANLLNGVYKDVGFGIANAENFQGNGPQTIVVAMYGSRIEAPAPEPEPAPTPVTPANTTPSTPEQKTPVAEPTESKPKPPEETAAKKTETPATTATPKPLKPQTQQVSRLQLLSDNSAWMTFVVTVIASVAAAIFLFRHSIFWHRAIIKGERFVARHHFLDIALVTIAVAAIVLTRTAGMIY